MTSREQKLAAKEFEEKWAEGGKENQHTQVFWLTLLRDVYGVENPEEVISFEKSVLVENIRTEKGNTKRIDGYIANTQVLIEQKDSTKSLIKKYSQSDGARLDAFEQADRYGKNLNHDENPRWIITCNFLEFRIYDMNRRGSEPEVIRLCDLPEMYDRLSFMVDPEKELTKQQQSISLGAGDIVKRLYDALLKQYANPENPDSLKDLNKLCVRIVFCLYAEDARIFDSNSTTMFHDYLKRHRTEDRLALINLFHVLDQDPSKGQRDPYLADDLAAFPYVNGGLFEDENIEIPRLGEEVLDLILDVACSFNWSKISPTIFGAVFESTLNPVTRRKGGMHYTSVENIHKVIDPLFLDGLKDEYKQAMAFKTQAARDKHLLELQEKMAGLHFLDPACGSGNFLTESFLSLRHIENDIIRETRRILEGQQRMAGNTDLERYIKVSISQFYGIEINDFAVAVARTALWIAEIQMKQETEELLERELNFLPLKSNPNIMEENALTYPWEELVNRDELDYIMGNPPFVGKKYQSVEQKSDMKYVFNDSAGRIGNLDYITAWFKKATEYMQNTNINTAFVATNSIVQGEHIPLFWKPLYAKYTIQIAFAHQTFVWMSESAKQASVHCVIIGFNAHGSAQHKTLFYSTGKIANVLNIHPYLRELPDVFIENRSTPISNCRALVYGSFALDDGQYTISESEYNELIAKDPRIEKYLKLFLGSKEFINGIKRYCIWLKDADIKEVRKIHILNDKVEKVKKWRNKSGRKETVVAAETPALFAEIRQPESDYLAIPITSSERRKYIPIGFMSKDIIASNHLLILPGATLYEFGVMISSTHMAWMRTVAGRLKSDYNYSARIVYNNFPWCTPTKKQKEKIEQAAQNILNARTQHPTYTLADMYDPTYMHLHKELAYSHQQNDKAVWEAYGKAWPFGDEEACVRWLMERYKEMMCKQK